MTRWLRLVAIVKTAASPVATTHSHAVRSACSQRVSSALTTGDAGSVAPTAATGPARARAVARHSPATLPGGQGRIQQCATHVRHLALACWYWPCSTATIACRRGPKARAGTTPAALPALWRHGGHRTRCSRCSVTTARTGGSSVTWWATNSSLGTPLRRGATQRAHVGGRRSTRRSTRPGGSTARWCATCPGCPPRPRLLGGPRLVGRLRRVTRWRPRGGTRVLLHLRPPAPGW